MVFATLADGGKQSGTSVIGPDHDDPLNFGIAVGVGSSVGPMSAHINLPTLS